jgi:hypothetical protein
MSSAM